MNCKKCNRPLPDDSRFCQYCGERQEVRKKTVPIRAKGKAVSSCVQQSDEKSASELLKRGLLALEEGKWKAANACFQQVLEDDVECAEAYFGKMMVEMRIHTKKELLFSKDSFDKNLNYQRAVRFAASPLREELEDLPKARLYTTSLYSLEQGVSMRDAMETLQTMRDYRDVEEQIENYSTKYKNYERRRTRTTRILVIVLAVLLALAVLAGYYWFWVVPEQKYERAMGYVKTKNYTEAFALFLEIDDHRDSQEQKEKLEPIMASHAKVGDTILYGSYEQDDRFYNGTEDIEWIVLEKKKDRILVVSKYVLDVGSFGGDGTWGNSDIRDWLHTDFMNKAFDKGLRSHITAVTNKTTGQKSTKDSVFLLSVTEVEKYLPKESKRKAAGTAYANAYREGWVDEGGAYWWLRSPDNDDGILAVDASGCIYDPGEPTGDSLTDAFIEVVESHTGIHHNRGDEYGVRPAMWIQIDEE